MSRISIHPSAFHGLGVFTESWIAEGTRIELCQVLPLRGVPDNTALWDHQLAWTDECDAIASGCALFYNHSDVPNVKMIRDIEGEEIQVIALRDIDVGEELLVKYACKPWW
jgi:hypothetical protein